MRAIRINDTMLKYFSSFIDEELSKANSVLSKARTSILELRANYGVATPEYQSLDQITTDFKTYLLLTPTKHSDLIAEWEALQPTLFYGPLAGGKIGTTVFGNEILTALNYPGFRKKYAQKLINTIQLKSCPYCNAMLTITTAKVKGKSKARFQLDHYFPKSKQPLLSISFFNLIPSCGNCNQSKSDSNVELGLDFHLFAEETPLSGFKFEISSDSLAKYQLTKDLNDITVKFVKTNGTTDVYVDHHNSTFDIEGIYNTQKDIVEEVLWIATAYNETRINELATILDLPVTVIKRLIVGNYIDEAEIHKRPLAKFKQDIAKQLKLI